MTADPGRCRDLWSEFISLSVQHFDAVIKFSVLVLHFRYEEQLKERESQLQKEDLSDMVAEHAAKQKVSDPILPFLSRT